MARKSADDRDSEIFDEVSKNINAWYEAYSINLENFRLDQNFLFVSQWDSRDYSEFNRLQKPMMTFNKIYDFFKKVVGEQRQNTPDLQVRCMDGDTSQDAIELRADIIRSISYNSKSNIVYQTAFENALAGGFGAMRIITDYEHPKSFNQCIRFERVDNPDRVFFDADAKDPTKADGDFCGYYDVMSKKDFESKYPDTPIPEGYPAFGNIKEFNWMTSDSVSIVEYYRKEYFTFTLHQLSDGTTVTDKELKKKKDEYESMMMQEDVSSIQSPIVMPEVVSSRKSKDYKIMCYKVIKDRILDKSEWPCDQFPIIFCPGDIHVVDGQERTLSFVRFVKDAQRFLNYCGSEIAQAIKNNRREQFLVTPDNISGEGLADMWRNPSIQQGALIAKPDSVTGNMPVQLQPPQISPSLLTQFQRAEMDIQSILGYYEANRGASGQELSGVALQERQRTGNMSVAVFFDNLDRMIEQAGRVVLCLLPTIYDTERRVSAQGADGKNKDITINRPIAGGLVENDVTKGRYDVCIESGPSFAVQRENALQLLVQLVSVNPQVFPLVADLIAQNIDIENMPQLVERLRTLVPPNILAQEQGLPPPPPQPQQPDPQMVLAQQNMQIKQAELQLKQQQQQLDAASSLRQQQIDAAKTELDMQKLQMDQNMAGVKAGAEMDKARLNYQANMAASLSKIMGAHNTLVKHNNDAIQSLDNTYRQ
jgi:hypothetical protein